MWSNYKGNLSLARLFNDSCTLCIQEEDEYSETDTVILENDPDENLDESSASSSSSSAPSAASASAELDMKINKRSAMVIIKAVTGRIPEREELVKMLKEKFKAQSKNLTALTATQILEVTARKLISLKYVSLKDGISSGDIRNTDITVRKEIQM